MIGWFQAYEHAKTAKNDVLKMLDTMANQAPSGTLPPLTPARAKSLKTVQGCRLELIRLYDQVKTGVVDPQVAGKLAHILNSLISSARDHQFEERLVELEARLKNRPNGHDRPGLRQ